MFKHSKDGGPDSTVDGWFFEVKSLFTVVLLKFNGDSREAFHGHAFNSISWLLKGFLGEEHLNGGIEMYLPGIRPIITKRETFHKVDSVGVSWVLSFRGPWAKTWEEYHPKTDSFVTLKHGRIEV